ncbi:RIO1 family regulatory kinase/ATPase [Methanothrix sp.]|uniref:RIO1 family regulatory kinase/ATPase domain-containing protein n=1 Tax=Methanothrix sp. TaxID=90426 RepID=UPI0034E1C46D
MIQLAERFLSLRSEDVILLRAIEAGMRRREWVPLEEISAISGIPASKAEYHLRLLSGRKLVTYTKVPYEGYQIEFAAYDLLALHDLVRRGFVASLGDRLGVGKESVVYEALDDIPMVIKFHREGRTSFSRVRRVRDYLRDRPKVAWIHAAALAARTEFEVMRRLYPSVSVPKPIARSRHAVAMERVTGVLLTKTELDDPEFCINRILEEIGKAYRLGVIHADLSEYNVIVGEDITIIDWPQAVGRDHESAEELLSRDVSNILKYFKRKYKINLNPGDVLRKIKVDDG